MVPTGTFRTMLSPSRPVQLEPSPWRPRSPLYSGLKRKWTSVLWRSLDSITMSPPRPPSPPEGPPRGTNFSRRKAMHPLPPSPPLILMIASSINMLSILIVQATAGIHRRCNPSTDRDTLVRDNQLLLQLAHGGDPFIHLFAAHHFSLRGNIPVVSTTIAHIGCAVPIELCCRRQKRVCSGFECALIGDICIRDVDLQRARHGRPLRAHICHFNDRITDPERRVTHCSIRPRIDCDLFRVKDFFHKKQSTWPHR